MELRVLQYFLAVTREQSILAAAKSLHVSQPTLSRQLKDLEEELGKVLFIRGNRHISLTEEGMILKKRAEEILNLVQKTETEISVSDAFISGDIYIGSGESDGIRHLLRAAKKLQEQYPNITFHIVSDDTENVIENLDRGLIDFGVLFGDVNSSKYETLSLDYEDTFGVLMRKDDRLAKKDAISPSDLIDQPLILSRQQDPAKHLGLTPEQIHIVGTYNLLYNGSLMVEEGMGYALCFDKIINVSGDSPLVFKPLDIPYNIRPTLVWKKYQVFAKASQKFLDIVKEGTL